MLDRDLVVSKLASIDRCLVRVEAVTRGEPASLGDIDVQDIAALNLQRAIQNTIGLAHHVVRAEGLGLGATARDAFVLLRDRAGLPGELADRMMSMVGFRDIAVHDYGRIDLGVLERIVTDHLDDLRQFGAWVARRLS